MSRSIDILTVPPVVRKPSEMLNRFAKSLAVILLLVQVLACFARGEQGLCIPTGDCGHHGAQHHDVAHHHAHDTGADHDCDAPAGLPTAWAIQDCDCCVHLPAPSDHQPGPTSRAEAGPTRMTLIAIAPAIVETLMARPSAVVWTSPPDPGFGAVARARKVTRLLI